MSIVNCIIARDTLLKHALLCRGKNVIDARKREFRNNFMHVLARSFGKWWKSSIKVMQRCGGKEMRSTSCKITKLWKSRKDARFPRESYMVGCVQEEYIELSLHAYEINPYNNARAVLLNYFYKRWIYNLNSDRSEINSNWITFLENFPSSREVN